jgi:hypothetical protein
MTYPATATVGRDVTDQLDQLEELDQLEDDAAAPAQLEDLEPRALPGRRVQITLDDGTPAGVTHVVRVTNRELVLWDRTAPKHKWGAAQDVPFLANTFTAWAAARRAGVIGQDVRFETFQELCLDVTDLPEDESDAARPTRKAPAAG